MQYSPKKTNRMNMGITFSNTFSNISNILFCLFLLLSTTTYASDHKTLELQHFWISSGEKAALSLLEKAFSEQNGKWIASPSPDYELMKRDFIRRISTGFPPSALWMGGEDIQSFHSLGLLLNLMDISQTTNIYDFALEQATINNSIVALPITIHNENWAWYNAEIYRKLGLSIPGNWDVFLQQAPIIQKAGYVPLAISEQSWNVRLLFTTMVAGVGGKELYNRLYVDEDLTVFAHPKIQRVLSILGQLRAFKPLPGQVKKWCEATHLLTDNQAAMQIMGDWVRGDLSASGIDFENKIICTTPPESEKLFITAIDFIAFPKVRSKEEQAGQQLFIKTILDKDIQIAFSNLKGSTPVRNDIQADQLNNCAAKSLPLLTSKGRRLLSPRMTMSENLRSALQKTLAAFWNNNDMTVKQVTLQLKNLNLNP